MLNCSQQIYSVSYIVYKNADNQQEFAYIAHNSNDDFYNAIEKGSVNPEEYGIVIERGLGEASNTLKERMADLFSCRKSVNDNTSGAVL